MEGFVAGQMQPSDYLMTLSVTDLWFEVLAHVEQYALNTPIFVSDNLTTEAVTPSNFALYLFGMALSHINRVGSLAGTNKMDVCMSPDEFVIPTAFGKFLEHLGPFTQDQCTIRTAYTLDTSLATTTATFGTSGPNWGANPIAFTPAFFNFNLLRQAGGTVGELQANNAGLPQTLAGLWGGSALLISQAIAGAGLSCVLYKSVPKTAPNASAYAIPWVLNATSGLVNATTREISFWTCFSQNFDPEEANLFGACGASRNITQVYSAMRPAVAMPIAYMFDPNNPLSETCPQYVAHCVNAWLGSRQSVYRPGPLLRSYVLCTQKVKHLAYSPIELSYSVVAQTAYTALNQFLRQTTNPISDTDMLLLIYLYYTITLQAVVARVNQCSPIHYLITTNRSSVLALANTFSNQAGYVSREWLSIQVPALITRLVDSIGPVVVDGTLSLPIIRSAPSNIANNWSDGTATPQMSIGQAVYFGVGPSANFENVLWSRAVSGGYPGGPFPFNVQPNGAPVTTPALQTYYPDGQAVNRLLFWNTCVSYFSGLWDSIHKKAFSGAGISSSLVHFHNPPCGSAAIMCSSAVLDSVSFSSTLPDLELVSGIVGTFASQNVRSINSMVNLGGDEVVECTMFPLSAEVEGGPEVCAKFRYRLPTTSATLQITQSYMAKTFSAESAFSKAIAAREADFSDVTANAGGIDIVSTADARGCWVRDLLKTVGRESFNALRFATPAAAGMVCNYFAPGTGGFCAIGAEKVVKTLSSWAGVEADGHEPPTGKEISAVKKAMVNPETAGLKAMGKMSMEVKSARKDVKQLMGSKKKTSRSASRGRSSGKSTSRSRSRSASRSQSRARVTLQTGPKRGRKPRKTSK